MNNAKTATGGISARTARNTRRLAYWTAAWLVTMALASFGPTLLWDQTLWLTVGAIVLNLAVGAGMIVANKRHLQGLDEMHQKIQLEAMALSLGVGLIAGLAYSNLDANNVIASDAEISHLVILMGLTYLAGIYRGHRQYR